MTRARKQTTYTTKPADFERRWYVVDAQGQTLGRLASKIVPYLTGKNKPIYSPHMDCGDFIVVINCEKIHVTGNRMDDKLYYRYSGYMGGLKQMTLREVLQRFPERAIYFAVKRMIDRKALGHQIMNKLKIYAGSEHPHAAQKPEKLEL
ncbi:MAG: 50S ribosomal protein L13 [Anaerolineae bacterium]|nr:50S ribosomal protein L13 [Anaerolineae bacterium]